MHIHTHVYIYDFSASKYLTKCGIIMCPGKWMGSLVMGR